MGSVFLMKNLDNLRLTTEDSKFEQIAFDGQQNQYFILAF
jgi:hypothetical protein